MTRIEKIKAQIKELQAIQWSKGYSSRVASQITRLNHDLVKLQRSPRI